MILDEKYKGRDGLTTRERFYQKIKIEESGCWKWLGCKRGRYGSFKFFNKNYLAHRFSYFLSTGYMPTEEEYICHHCDNTSCVNPEHLFLGNQFDNMRDMAKKGRGSDNKGDKNPNSRVNWFIVKEIRFLHSIGVSGEVLAKKYGISRTQSYRIINKQSWVANGSTE